VAVLGESTAADAEPASLVADEAKMRTLEIASVRSIDGVGRRDFMDMA
jgi:hypothetical protein